MEFLGVGPLELLFIILIALIVIGPRDMAKTARTVGRFLNRLYKSEAWQTITDASRTLRTLPNRLAREAALEELNDIRNDLEQTGQVMTEEIAPVSQDLMAAANALAEEASNSETEAPPAAEQTDSPSDD